MDTIKIVKETTTKQRPYPTPLRAKIVKIFQNERAVELSLADHTGCIKCVAYDDISKNFHPGDVILIRQFQKGTSGVLLLNKGTYIRQCPKASFKEKISDEILALAKNLVDPPAPAVKPISSIHQENPPTVTAVTVQGIIVHDELPKVVGATRQTVRNIHVEDESGSIQIALWNQKSSSPVKAGDRVKITHVTPKHDNFIHQMTLMSTKNTKVDVIPEDIINLAVEILTVEGETNNEISLLCQIDDDIKTLQIPKPVATKLWHAATTSEVLKELEKEQFFTFGVQGNTIVRITDTKKASPAASTSTASTSTTPKSKTGHSN